MVDLNLTDEPSEREAASTPLRRPAERDPRRERTREALANKLVWLLIGATVGAGVLAGSVILGLSDAASRPLVTDVLQIVYPPIVALVGSAVGFYFGSPD